MARQTHPHWGSVATPADLYNVAGSPNSSPNLALGDQAFSISDSTTYQCTDPTVGAATWSAMGGSTGGGAGSYLDWGGQYTYTEAPVPVEEVIGGGDFNGDFVGSLYAFFRAVVDPVMSNVPGDEAYIILYDMGPRDGPLDLVPREVTRLTATANGLQRLGQALTVDATPGANEISNTERLYEVAITSNATSGDVVYVRSCGLDVRGPDAPH